MEFLPFYSDTLQCHTKDKVFEFLISSLKPSNTAWSYFVDWEKVFHNKKEIEMALNSFNYLIGKNDFDVAFRDLIKETPKLARYIPALVVRDGSNTKKFKILVDYQSRKLVYEDYNFDKKNPSDEDIEKYLRFIDKTGLKSLLVDKKIKNLVDYMIGVEAGLNSNARKNRSGHVMEDIVECFIKDVCKKHKFTYLKEANAEKIKSEFDYRVPVDKTSRKYDYVINNGKELFIIETNFYGGGGSKLKATAGEYQTLFDTLKKDGYQFFWITDGEGWNSAKNPLRETFNHNDYIFNLAMLENDILEYVLYTYKRIQKIRSA